MDSFHLEVVTPQGKAFDGEVLQLSVRGTQGDLAVMAGHIPFVTAVQPCECRIYDTNGEMQRAELLGGILCVSKEKTQVLSSMFREKE